MTDIRDAIDDLLRHSSSAASVALTHPPGSEDHARCQGKAAAYKHAAELLRQAVDPVGCSSCPNATMRFNGGNGATTCGALGERIVMYGHSMPDGRPAVCPLGPAGSASFPDDAHHIVSVWAEDCAGPGWANQVLWILYRDSAGNLHMYGMQPHEWRNSINSDVFSMSSLVTERLKVTVCHIVVDHSHGMAESGGASSDHE